MVGATLVRKLVEDGNYVRILVRSQESSHPFLQNIKVEKHVGDLELIETLAHAMRGCNSIIHCAGMISYASRDRERLYAINRSGTENMLMAAMATDIDRFVHVSSTATIGYSSKPHPLNENALFRKRYRSNAYMHSKWLAEEAVRKAVQVGFNATIVCPSTIYGAGDIHFNNGRVFSDMLSGRLKSVPPGGNGAVAAGDVVAGILLALEKGQPGRRYILNSENMTYVDFFAMTAELLDIEKIEKKLSRKTRLPIKMFAGALDSLYAIFGRAAPISSSVIDFTFAYRYFNSERARYELGWQPTKNIRQACEEAIEFYTQHGLLPAKKMQM